MPTTTEKKQLTVKPEFNHFSQDVDEYTAQLPIMIRESIRQALYSEYEGNYERVEEICSSLLEKNPGNPEALAILGRVQLSQRKYQEAEKTFRELLEKEPDRNLERMEYGIVFHALGRYREAIRELLKADPEQDYHPFYNSTLGDCYENTGNRQKAREAFHAETARWEETGEMLSPENLDGCFCKLIYLDGVLSQIELSSDLESYRRFLQKTEMTPNMKDHLANNIAYWSALLTIPAFRIQFVKFVKDVEEEGYLIDSPGYRIIDSAYRAEESYRYHEDKSIDAFLESFLSAEAGEMMEDRGNAVRATQLAHEWYMTKCIDEYAQLLLYVAEQYPHTYARTVTFLDQLQSSGPEKMRERILDLLQEEEIVKAKREDIIEELEQSYKRVRKAKKDPIYIAEGGVTYKRSAKKIMPNDPCPCGSGKKYKKCHGR